MDSATSKLEQEARKQEGIKRQIALLQAQLVELPDSSDLPPRKKQKTEEPTVFEPSTPSPQKKKLAEERQRRQLSPTPAARKPQTTRSLPQLRTSVSSSSRPAPGASTESASRSAFVSQLRTLNPSKTEKAEPVIQRTEGFSEEPVVARGKETVRDNTLAIVEDLELGPAEHKPLADDPTFEKLEPNTGIRLSSRKLSHDALQEHLRGRYFLPPSLLYSVVRLLPNKQAYEVPVEGDWVTIAVVAERGDVRFTSGAGNIAKVKEDEDDTTPTCKKDGDNKQASGKRSSTTRKKGGDDEDDENAQKGGKKYVHLKLVDLGHRSRSSSSHAPRGTLRGDAQLSLLLFESDYYDKLISKDEKGKEKVQKLWRGGSGGAFEECFSKLHPGAVVALLNPKVLKPFQNTKNPTSSSILALTPPSASAIAVVGQARDLGRCTVRRRDGKHCGAWVDKRVSSSVAGSSKSTGEDVCEYHVQNAIQRTRASRAEFSIGTSGMTSTARKRKAVDYDPVRQWGLKPEAGSRGPDGEATYVIGGHVASSSSRVQPSGVAGETMGREGQARAKRRIDMHGDKALKELLEANKSGGSAIAEGSREAVEMVRKAKEALAKAKVKEKESKNKPRIAGKKLEGDDDSEEIQIESVKQVNDQAKKKSYSAEMVKKLGFDPTLKSYSLGGDKKKAPLSLLNGQKRKFNLGPPPGKKVRSGVTAPTSAVHGEESDSDLEIEP